MSPLALVGVGVSLLLTGISAVSVVFVQTTYEDTSPVALEARR